MAVKVFGMNHVALEVTDVEAAVRFYQEVFDLPPPEEGEGQAFFRIGKHQFLAIFVVDQIAETKWRHFDHRHRRRRDRQGARRVQARAAGSTRLRLRLTIPEATASRW